ALDVYQRPDQLVVKASLPGVKPEDVDITVTGDTLTIQGETKADEEVKREDYIYQEHRYGSFSRSLALPPNLRTDKADASFEDGILTVTIPRAEEAKPKAIKVKPRGMIEGEKKEQK
ncbi:MAG: Hsp20/alpha crystallin family protein, partial [Chloroflexota bacterium]